MFKFLTDTPQKKTALYFLGAVLVLALVAVNGQKVRCRNAAATYGYYPAQAGNHSLRGKLAENALACPASDFEFYVPPSTVTSGLYSNPRLQFNARQ
ncbi:MAG: hypothetical protein ACAH80_07350 [Alphaproteobacteria bacterium]